jgi:hypothetical protein
MFIGYQGSTLVNFIEVWLLICTWGILGTSGIQAILGTWGIQDIPAIEEPLTMVIQTYRHNYSRRFYR